LAGAELGGFIDACSVPT